MEEDVYRKAKEEREKKLKELKIKIEALENINQKTITMETEIENVRRILKVKMAEIGE